MGKTVRDKILSLLKEHGPVSVLRVRELLKVQYHIDIRTDEINSLLYGELREQVIRDKDESGYPTWRVKVGHFEAAQGLEVMLYSELLRQHIVTEDDSHLGYQIHNRRNGKSYDLDIAIIDGEYKLNIEIDGFEHVRADARLSIQEQIEKHGEDTDIEIDWMDNTNSYTDFKLIDNKNIFRWLATHQAFCQRYHEELLKPHDITRNIWLIENGWKVIRFWNFEVKEDMIHCIEDIKSLL